MRFFILIILVYYFTADKSQDLILTDKCYTLNSKITKIKCDYIHFNFKYKNVIRVTLLHVGQIKFYKKGYFSNPDVSLDKIKDVGGNFQKLSIGGHGGWSNMSTKGSINVPINFIKYVKALKSGYHFGDDFIFLISECNGFDARCSMFRIINIHSNT